MPAREVEDLAALIEVVGGSAHVFGSSSGAMLALRAGASGLSINKLALFEPPLRVDAQGALPENFRQTLGELIDDGHRSEAVKYFMKHELEVPGPMLAVMPLIPGVWKKMKAMAPTLRYDYEIMGDTLSGRPLSSADWSTVSQPVLVMDAEKSPARFKNAADELARVLPLAKRHTLQRQSHAAVVMRPKCLVGPLVDFYGQESPEFPTSGPH